MGILMDVENSIAWTGDFCVEPTTEGAWQAGRRAGRLRNGFSSEKPSPVPKNPIHIPAPVSGVQDRGGTRACLDFGE